jgi:hypothetical protein
MKVDNNNTKCFHQFMNFHKNVNMIYKVRSLNYTMDHSFKEKDEEGVIYLKSLF